jgi:hypothetical protein
MSHPDPLFDPDNSYEDDEMFTEPNDSDVPFVEYLYDDHNDFWGLPENELNELQDEEDEENDWDDSYDDSMDGDHDSAMESAGWGTDEDYGYYGDDTNFHDDYYGGE